MKDQERAVTVPADVRGGRGTVEVMHEIRNRLEDDHPNRETWDVRVRDEAGRSVLTFRLYPAEAILLADILGEAPDSMPGYATDLGR